MYAEAPLTDPIKLKIDALKRTIRGLRREKEQYLGRGETERARFVTDELKRRRAELTEAKGTKRRQRPRA